MKGATEFIRYWADLPAVTLPASLFNSTLIYAMWAERYI